MTTLRIFRVLRIFRSLRIVRHMTQLRLLIQGFADSLQAVIWIFILFLFIVFFAGIFVTTVTGHNKHDWDTPDAEDYDPEDVETIDTCFGKLPRSMFTMFRFVTLDDWAAVTMVVMKKQWPMAFFFVIYILITAFAVIALLTGVMAERVSCRSKENEESAEKDTFKDWVLSQEQKFKAAGTTSDGETGLTFEELWAHPEIDLKKIITKIQGDRSGNANSDVSDELKEDVSDLFKALDLSGDGRVSWEEFKYGMKHVYGDASARDIAILRADVNRILAQVKKRDGKEYQGVDPWEKKTDSLEQRMGRIEGLLRELVRGLTGQPPSGTSRKRSSP